MRFYKLASVLAAVVIGTVAFASAAQAQNSGFVRGRLWFFQAQGSFCDPNVWAANGVDCTGSRYTLNDAFRAQPAKEVKLKVKNSSGGTVGTGSTDADGDFFVLWQTNGSFLNMRIEWETAHANGRFKVTDMNGATRKAQTSQFNGIAAGNIVDIGDRFWDNASAPSTFRNAYDGAWMMWTNSLAQSSKMVSRFTNVTVRGFVSSAPGSSCPTSCADAPNKRVTLDNSAPFRPDPRVMHELGHIASSLSDGSKQFGDGQGVYCYPSSTQPTGGCGWSLDTAEWRAPQFEESFATFLGNVALWHWNSNAPHTCFGGATATGGTACAFPNGAVNYNLETSFGFGNGTTCSPTGDEDHAVINVIRWLWDIYDGPAQGEDTATVCNCGNIAGCQMVTDTDGQDQFEFIDVRDNYVKGTSTNQHNEPWNSSLSSIDQRDGKAYKAFRNNWRDRGPAARDTTNNLCVNCLFPFLPQ